MSFLRPSVDPHSPPAEFDAVVDWFERVCYNLVLLEEYPLLDVRQAVRTLERSVREHLAALDAALTRSASIPAELTEARTLLRTDHAWFLVSLEQLEGLYHVVEGEDHGGHRQALGQYGRVLAEALRRHRSDERAYLAATARHRVPPAP
jgi:hypothetical protein